MFMYISEMKDIFRKMTLTKKCTCFKDEKYIIDKIKRKCLIYLKKKKRKKENIADTKVSVVI